MRIWAAVLNAPNAPFIIEELELEAFGAGGVQVKISSVGVCHSDWHLVKGATRHPFLLVAGHEGSGVVEEIGEGVANLQVGDHVALNWAPSCGRCFYCLRNRSSLCSAYLEPIWAGTMMDGSTRLSRKGTPVYHYCSLAAFAERVVVPDGCCVPTRKEPGQRKNDPERDPRDDCFRRGLHSVYEGSLIKGI